MWSKSQLKPLEGGDCAGNIDKGEVIVEPYMTADAIGYCSADQSAETARWGVIVAQMEGSCGEGWDE